MLPSADNLNYPVFVPDQVLTRENLNDLFSYLEEQERLTRTNLIGIGIVCGLEVKTGVDGNGRFLTITKGTGVTSSGYLVSIPEITYHNISDFSALQCAYYDRFVTNSSPRVQKFPLWQLRTLADPKATSSLTANGVTFLDNKAVMIFVELLETNNKNCDPNSCDEKGVNVEINFIPLLIRTSDIPAISVSNSGVAGFSFLTLPVLSMPRWDLPASHPVASTDISDSFKKPLSNFFLTQIENALSQSYNIFKPVIADEYPSNPFSGFASAFATQINNLTELDSVHVQYYYDFISDICLAYKEFYDTGAGILSSCCPDENLFPRHLILGPANGFNLENIVLYRQYFIASVLFENPPLLLKLKLLFRRMDLLNKNLQISATTIGSGKITDDTNIRITPSVFSRPLSEKAIPFYYKVNELPKPVFKNWNYELNQQNRANKLLSYHAAAYAVAGDKATLTPLLYDQEPFNFYRIEGITGKNITGVLATMQKRMNENRLPFTLLALRAGDPDLETMQKIESDCYIKDLEINYDIVRREWEAVIGKMIEYLDDQKQNATKWIEFEQSDEGRQAVYEKQLQQGKKFMVNDLPDFILLYPKFISLLEQVEWMSLQIREDLEELVGTIGKDRKPDPLVEDLIDHFDEVIFTCKKGAFRALYQEYSKRWKEAYGKLYFGEFIKAHPGVQHKAGVSTGGTFIIVYHSVPIKTEKLTDDKKRKSANSNFVIRGNVVDDTGAPLSFVPVADNSGKRFAETDSKGNFSFTATNQPDFIDVMMPGVGIIRQPVPGTKDTLIIVPSQEIKEDISNLPNGIVIADFYLPYTCCSDCASIQFVINEATPPANLPPIANAGEDQSGDAFNTFLLNGSLSSDPEGSSLKYLWEYKSGPSSFLIDQADAVIAKLLNLIPGIYVFTLTVTDDQGLTDSDEIQITALGEDNNSPIAVATANPVSAVISEGPVVIQLSGEGSFDPDGDAISFKWEYFSGPAGFTLSNDDKKQASLLTNEVGIYTFRLHVTDTASNSSAANVSFEITAPINQPPVAIAEASKKNLAWTETLVLSAINSFDPEGSSLTYSWKEANNNKNAVLEKEDQPVTNVNFRKDGIYLFTLVVTDDQGATGIDSVSVTVQMNLQRIKTCTPLADTISLFNNLPQNDSAANFKKFKGTYTAYPEVEEYYRMMQEAQIAAKESKEQIEFFRTTEIEFRLPKWIDELGMFWKNNEFTDLAMAMLRVHSTLAYHIACIQKEDVGEVSRFAGDAAEAEIKMESALSVYIDQLDMIASLQVKFITNGIVTTENMQRDAEAERSNTINGGEAQQKPLYMDMLSKIISMLELIFRGF